jgi:hypothetical protein
VTVGSVAASEACSGISTLVATSLARTPQRRGTYATKLSIEVSIGFVFNDLRKEASPGVRTTAVDGMVQILFLSFFCFFFMYLVLSSFDLFINPPHPYLIFSFRESIIWVIKRSSSSGYHGGC